MKCRICGEIEEWTIPVENGLCWWCETDAKEPDPYTGGMKPKSVFPLMDELEAEWGVTDD